MNRKIINTAVCDAREVTEESLQGFESIEINTAVLITCERSRDLFNRYPVALNAASVIDAEGEVFVNTVNGRYEIGANADGSNTILIVNGKLTAENGSLDALNSFIRIVVNGKALMPGSFKGQLKNITFNGKTIYYPDGAAVLKANTEINDLFVLRASNDLYYCPGSMFILDVSLDTDMILKKGLRFSSDKIVIAESLSRRLITQIDEDAEIVTVPDGAKLIDDDTDLKMKTIRKYGSKLCVCGDVSINDGDALAALEFLYSDGRITVSKELEDAFDEIDSIYDELKIIDPDMGFIADRPIVKIGRAVLAKYPKGVSVEDCAKVSISADLSPEEIMDKVRISDCALICCSKEQEEAVNIIAEDVAKIDTSDDSSKDRDGVLGILGEVFGNIKDTQIINSAEYKM